MGNCCRKKNKREFFQLNLKLQENKDKRAQLQKLSEIYKAVEREINFLKTLDIKKISENIKERSCYLAKMQIVLKWFTKIVDVNPEVW